MALRRIQSNADIGVGSFNQLIDAVNAAMKINVSGGLSIERGSRGTTIIGVPGSVSSGTSLLKAYCKEDAGTGSTITCFLGSSELNVRVWSATTTYIVGDIVTYGDKWWISANATNLNNTPAEDAYWDEITAYNEATTYNITTAVWCLYDAKLWRSKTTGNTGNAPEEGTYWTTKAPAYAAGTAYVVGDRVTSSSIVYRCIQAETGKTPATETAYWSAIDEIEVYCNISCGTQLQFASPLLYEQFMINVEYSSANARYECVHPFAAVEETCAEGGMLELVSEIVTEEASNSTTDLEELNNTEHSMAFQAAANSTYLIDMVILYTAAAATTGIKLGVSGPSDKVSINGSFIGWNDAAISGQVIDQYYDGTDDAYHNATATFSRTATGTLLIQGSFVLQTGDTAGWFKLMYASEVGSSMVTIKTGSNIKYRRTQYELP